jgi:hypothetical protein
MWKKSNRTAEGGQARAKGFLDSARPTPYYQG